MQEPAASRQRPDARAERSEPPRRCSVPEERRSDKSPPQAPSRIAPGLRVHDVAAEITEHAAMPPEHPVERRNPSSGAPARQARAHCWQHMEPSGFVAHELSALRGWVSGLTVPRLPLAERPRTWAGADSRLGAFRPRASIGVASPSQPQPREAQVRRGGGRQRERVGASGANSPSRVGHCPVRPGPGRPRPVLRGAHAHGGAGGKIGRTA